MEVVEALANQFVAELGGGGGGDHGAGLRLVIQAFGHMPTRNEETTIDGFRFEVIKADQRKIYTLRMRLPHS